jgi:hypothetical protein
MLCAQAHYQGAASYPVHISVTIKKDATLVSLPISGLFGFNVTTTSEHFNTSNIFQKSSSALWRSSVNRLAKILLKSDAFLNLCLFCNFLDSQSNISREVTHFGNQRFESGS